MKKIPSLFKRDYEGTRQVYDEIVPGSEWVAAGEGVATRKWDGTSCMIRGGKLYRRYDAKAGRTPPDGFEPAQDAPDPQTGHWPGWVPVGDSSEDRWHVEALSEFVIFHNTMYDRQPDDGTYELIGPKIQGNPEKATQHLLVKHGSPVLTDAPRDFEGIMAYLATHDMEGIVWHHPDGRMVKIKAKDFGIKRGGNSGNR